MPAADNPGGVERRFLCSTPPGSFEVSACFRGFPPTAIHVTSLRDAIARRHPGFMNAVACPPVAVPYLDGCERRFRGLVGEMRGPSAGAVVLGGGIWGRIAGDIEGCAGLSEGIRVGNSVCRRIVFVYRR